MVPAMINSIVKHTFSSKSSFRSLRLVWSAGAVLDESLQDQMYRLLEPSARVVQVWRMTETGYIATFLYPESDHTGSVGRLLPGVEAHLVAEGGEIFNRYQEEGEIQVRSSLHMQGYLNDPEASGKSIDSGGWLRTGDIGYMEHGKFYIVDRREGMIKVHGWQVSPAEPEAILVRHPDILEAAVIGTKFPNNIDEAPRAYIVKKPGNEIDEVEVKQHMLLYLAMYKALNGGVVFKDSIPRTLAGKVSKRLLQERADKESKEILVNDLILSAISAFEQPRPSVYKHPDSATASQSG